MAERYSSLAADADVSPGLLTSEDEPQAGMDQPDVGNRLLQLLDPDDYALLRPHLERVPLEVGAELARAGDPIETVCFLECAVAGFLDVVDDERRLTVGLVGREGCVGWPLLLGYDRWPYDVSVRAENGTALRIEAGHLAVAIERSIGLRTMLLRFAGTFTAQMGRTIVSNLIHSIEKRTARWILLYQDRVHSEEIMMTHEELGLMLGVRRSSVTDALHTLEGAGFIRSLRGRVIVRDRPGLEALAAETYGFAEAEYARLIGPFVKQRA